MAFLDELKAVFVVAGRAIKEFFSDTIPLGQHKRSVGMAFVLVLLAAGGFLGYRSYRVSLEQQAYHSFADYMQDFQDAEKSENSAEWKRLADMLGHAYVQHKGTSLAPLFLSLKADVQSKLGETVEALNTLQRALDAMPIKSKLSSLLSVKQAMMKLDAKDEELSQLGLKQLAAIGRDKDEEYKDLALFYLGRYYWAHDKLDDAKASWNELVDSSWQDKAHSSPWVAEAKQKLQQISA